VNSLSEEGLVTRKKDTEDRRKTELSLTPAGKKTLLLAKKHCFTILAELFESLSEKDLQALQLIQEKIVNHLHSVWTTPEKPSNP
jgi:DNA-binding MarR family transcriptional regulator